MKKYFLLCLVSLPAMMLALYTQAHDPKEHMQNTEKLDCSAMKNMDHSKMDMDDPVVLAIMEKCKEHMDDENEKKEDKHAKHKDHADDTHKHHTKTDKNSEKLDKHKH